MKEITIKNFDLEYDGMYFIKWENHRYRVYLQLNTLLKMIKIEGLTFENIDKTIKNWKPIHFNKVEMVVNGDEENGTLSLLTSEMSDEYLGKKNLTMIEIELKEK